MTPLSTTGEMSANALPIDLIALARQELDAVPRGRMKVIAADSEIPLWRLREINDGKKKLALHEAAPLMRALGSTRLLEALARSLGGVVFFVRRVAGAGHDDLHETFEAAVEDLAAISRETREALKGDNEIDADEARRIVGRISGAQATLQAYSDLVERKVQRRGGPRAVASC